MIGKLLPRALNKDTDERLIKSYEMVDAVNVQISTDDSGDNGVIKNIRSTEAATNTDEYEFLQSNDDVKVVGSVEDHENGYVYFFVWNSTALNHAILKYDISDNSYTIVAEGNLNFPEYGYVDAAILNDPTHGDSSIIFFTDNNNEPRKVNVNRLPDGFDINQSITLFPEYLHACIKTPVLPIQFKFVTDNEYSNVNNFWRQEGCYFAYRYILKDGFYSPISVYSKVAIPFNNVQQGDNGVLYNSENCCILTLPDMADYDGEIEKIQIMYRDGNAGNMYLIEEVSPDADIVREANDTLRTIWDYTNREYRFYNNESLQVVSEKDVLKMFEGVPSKAAAVEIAGDRLMYGNYIDGVDNYDLSNAVIKPVYSDIEDVDLSIDVSSTYTTGTSTVNIDLSNLPTAIQQDSVLSLVVAFNPDAIYNYDGANSTAINAAGSLQDSLENDLFFGEDINSPLIAVNPNINFEIVVSVDAAMSKSSLLSAIVDIINGNTVNQNVDVISTNLTSTSNTHGSITINGGSSYQIDAANFSFSAVNASLASNIVSFDVKMSDVTDVVFAIGNNYPTVTDEDGFFNLTTAEAATVRYIANTESALVPYDNGNYFSAGQKISSFKAGCNHEFGVVYYDGRGRRSNVCYAGSTYVRQQGERQSKGRASVNIGLAQVIPPPWATHYQIVYGGNSTINEFVQFSVPDAYITNTEFDLPSGTTSPTEVLFVPTAFLQNSEVSYAEVTGAVTPDLSPVLYTHSHGDILRIISYNTDDTTVEYPVNYNFEVLGVVTLTEDENPLYIPSTSSETYSIGEFLVLRNNPNNTGFTRSDVLNDSDKWKNRVFVEVFKPKKNKDEGEIIFYETGVVGTIENNNHTPSSVQVHNGDCFFRKKYMNNNYSNNGSFFLPLSNTDEGWQFGTNYDNFYLETESFNDRFKSDTVNQGRAAFVVDTSKEIRRKSSITFSERHVLANGRSYILSFNKHENNRYDLPVKYGAINRIIDQSETITCLQDRKVSRVPIDRSIISTATGNESLILSTEPFGLASFYQGDYGSSNDPSAVIKIDGNVFFTDKRVGKVLKLSNEGVSVISDANMSSFFEDNLLPANNITDYYLTAGYDPMNEEVLFSLVDFSGSGLTFTAGYSVSKNFWKSRYSFSPTKYAHMNGRLISCRKPFNGELIHLHEEGDDYNLFYGGVRDVSSMSLIMNYNPSMSKTMQSISIEGTTPWNSEVYTYDNDGTRRTSGQFTSFVEKENTWWSSIPKSRVGYRIPIGDVTSVDGNNVTFSNNVANIAIPNGVITNQSGTAINTIETSNVFLIDENTLQISGTPSVGDTLYITPNGTQNGDPIKGQYCHVDLSINTASPIELYAVNIDFVPSRLDASLGTQAE